MRTNLLHECNPNKKIAEKVFTSQICSQCANSRCSISRYKDDATKRKIESREKLLVPIDPEQIPLSPLTYHKAEVPSKVETSSSIDESIKNLYSLKDPQQNERFIKDGEINTHTNDRKILPLVDPWKVPSIENLHKEYATIAEDPWSTSYSGPINIRAGKNPIIRMPKK